MDNTPTSASLLRATKTQKLQNRKHTVHNVNVKLIYRTYE